MLNLATTSHSIRSIFAPIIERNFTFRVPNTEALTIYAPCQVIGTFTHPWPARKLPSVTHLSLKSSNDLTPLKQLPNLTHLYLGKKCNGFITDDLPSSLQSLTFHRHGSYIHPLGTLPSGLVHLALPEIYILNETLPNITKLQVGKISLATRLPESLTSLHVYQGFDNYSLLATLPNLTHLVLGSIKQHIGVLPPSLLSLEFENSFNSPRLQFDHKIEFFASYVTSLKLSNYFNKEVDNLPSTLTHLHFGTLFNRPVDHLPRSIAHLTLGERFNCPVDHLPPSLHHLRFGTQFNHPIDHLPHSLTHLIFGDENILHGSTATVAFEFQQSINNLPSSLTHLSFGTIFKDDYWHLIFGIDEEFKAITPILSLPESLIFLRLCFTYEEDVEMRLDIDHYPPSLKYLFMGSYTIYPPLPHSLTHLHFHRDKPALPSLPNLTHLSLYADNASNLPPLPRLHSVSIGHNHGCHAVVDLFLLSSIRNIDSYCHNRLLLPHYVTHLCFSEDFNEALSILPSTLTHIAFGAIFNQPIDNIPGTVESLFFGHAFDKMVAGFPRLSRLVLVVDRNSMSMRKFGAEFYQLNKILPWRCVVKELRTDFLSGRISAKYCAYRNFKC